MKRLIVLFTMASLVVALATLSGCWSGSGNPVAGLSSDGTSILPVTPIVGITPAVTFRLILPEDASKANLRAAITGTATVTFSLILVSGNPASPTTTMTQVVPVASDGSAVATFTNVSALTVIGDVRIAGGKIGSYTEFQGAQDLVALQNNILYLAPKGGLSRIDLIAEVIRRLVASTAYQSRILPQLATRIDAGIRGFTASGTAPYDAALAAYLAFADAQPPLVIATATPIASQSVGIGPATITVSLPGSPVNGLEIRIPEGAFEGGAMVNVSAAAISSYSLPIGLQPISPLIAIDTGGKVASTPMEVKIPLTIPSGKSPVAFLFHPESGRLEALPFSAADAQSITILGNTFAPIHSIAGNRRFDFFSDALKNAGRGIIVTGVDNADIPDTDSGFRPGKHTWKSANYGSYIAPGGFCAGWSMTVMWCFAFGIEPSLYGNYDLNKTADIGEDDIRAIRFGSMIQKDMDFNSIQRNAMKNYSAIDDRLTFTTFRAALAFSKTPQYISVRNASGGHALMVYRTQGNNLYVADPNFPDQERIITIENGKFKPFPLSLKVGAPEMLFTEFNFFGNWALIKESTIANRWNEFLGNTVGNGKFPMMEYFEAIASTPRFLFAPLGAQTIVNTPYVRISAKADGVHVVNNNAYLFKPGTSTATLLPGLLTTDDEAHYAEIPLASGDNRLGVEFDLLPPGKQVAWYKVGTETFYLDNCAWTDFRWFDIAFLASPANVVVKTTDAGHTLTWDPVPGAESYSLYWSDKPGVTIATGTRIKNAVSPHQRTDTATMTQFYYIVAAERAGITSQPSTETMSLRFERDANGIVIDHKTNLQWIRAPYPRTTSDSYYTWAQAQAWASTAADGGGGWKLPTIAELQTLGNEAYAVRFYPAVPEYVGFFPGFSWTSEVSVPDNPDTSYDDTEYFIVDIDKGKAYSRPNYESMYQIGVRKKP